MFQIFGNISDVLLKLQQLTNQHNTKRNALLYSFTHHRDRRFNGNNTLEIT